MTHQGKGEDGLPQENSVQDGTRMSDPCAAVIWTRDLRTQFALGCKGILHHATPGAQSSPLLGGDLSAQWVMQSPSGQLTASR